MFKQLTDWFDNRTGYRAAVHHALHEPIPGGAKLRYVWGSALASAFFMQVATGILLMFSYSPGSSTAWGSVFYINEVMQGGWFLRGLHHFGSQAMIILLGLHILQVVLAGAYRAPREVNWWLGIALLLLTVSFGLTGYLLPWDQKGYWATKVATNIAAGTPVLGPAIQKVIVGGAEYGNQTLTRFYGLHVGVFPALFVLFLVAHLTLFRKHGVTAPRNAQGIGPFWPDQLFLDALASVAVVGVIVALVWVGRGAPLDAPADPSSSDYPARPEWYFLSLYQMLKYFPGDREVIGTLVVPGAIFMVLFCLPLLDKVLPGKVAHFVACAFLFALFGGVGYLTFQAMQSDETDPTFQHARRNADAARQRAFALARDPDAGIPPDGANYLLLRDPLTHGRAVLEAKCLACHHYDGKGVETLDADGKTAMSPQHASDLKDFGSRAWVRGLLENPKSDAFFGKVPALGGMARWKRTSKLTGAELDAVADFVASFARIPRDMSPQEWMSDPANDPTKHPGFAHCQNECGKCHVIGEPGLVTEGGEEDAPNLFAWGSPQWIERMIRKPGAPDHYGFLEPKDQMPSFAEQLTPNDLETLVRYLRGDYPGAPAASPSPAPSGKAP